jgi:hypothetical protein
MRSPKRTRPSEACQYLLTFGLFTCSLPRVPYRSVADPESGAFLTRDPEYRRFFSRIPDLYFLELNDIFW